MHDLPHAIVIDDLPPEPDNQPWAYGALEFSAQIGLTAAVGLIVMAAASLGVVFVCAAIDPAGPPLALGVAWMMAAGMVFAMVAVAAVFVASLALVVVDMARTVRRVVSIMEATEERRFSHSCRPGD